MPHKLSSKPGTDPNAPGAANASGDEEAKAAVVPKVYQEKIFTDPESSRGTDANCNRNGID